VAHFATEFTVHAGNLCSSRKFAVQDAEKRAAALDVVVRAALRKRFICPRFGDTVGVLATSFLNQVFGTCKKSPSVKTAHRDYNRLVRLSIERYVLANSFVYLLIF
jgi:hypothetical protein